LLVVSEPSVLVASCVRAVCASLLVVSELSVLVASCVRAVCASCWLCESCLYQLLILWLCQKHKTKETTVCKANTRWSVQTGCARHMTAVDTGSLLSVYRGDRTADRSVQGSTHYTVYCWYRIVCESHEGICHIYVTNSTSLTTGGRHGEVRKKVCT